MFHVPGFFAIIYSHPMNAPGAFVTESAKEEQMERFWTPFYSNTSSSSSDFQWTKFCWADVKKEGLT